MTLGPVGAALPIVQGTSFAFLPIMIPLVEGKGVDALGVMSRHVVTCGAIFLIICGLVPKVGVIRTVPIEVLGCGVIVMFDMLVAAGISIPSDVDWNRRNMVIFAIALSIGLGLQLEPGALRHMPDTT